MSDWDYSETTTYLGGVEPPRGASLKTLERRVKYGGRKGRRAWQRLLKYPMPVTLGMWFTKAGPSRSEPLYPCAPVVICCNRLLLLLKKGEAPRSGDQT